MIDLRMAFKSAIREEAVPPVYSREDLLAARFRVARVLPYQQSHAPFVSNLLLAVFSGLLSNFAVPEWRWWSFGWVCTAPLVMAVARERRFWGAFILGWTTGTIFYMGTSYWVTYSMHHYGDIALWLSYVILMIFSAALGVFTALFAGLLALVIKRFGGWAILAAPVLWAASEWLRLQITGVGWNALGYSQAFQPSVIGIARLGGVYMVSALLVAASTALVFGVIYFERRRGFVVLTAVILLVIIAVLTRRNRVTLLMNSWGFPKDSIGRETQYNSALVIAPSGEKIAEYDKMALVPFGEYIPARNWLPFAKDLRALVGDITPGTSFTLGEAAGARLGTLICFEATRPDLARRLRREGASALVQISNESWFGPTAMPRQMLAQSIFRAVENNVEVIRATNSGLSAFVHPTGQTEGETAMFETATRVWQVKSADEAQTEALTFYTRHGDLFAVACAILSVLLVGAAFIPERVSSDE